MLEDFISGSNEPLIELFRHTPAFVYDPFRLRRQNDPDALSCSVRIKLIVSKGFSPGVDRVRHITRRIKYDREADLGVLYEADTNRIRILTIYILQRSINWINNDA